MYIRPVAVLLRHTTYTCCQLLRRKCLYLRKRHIGGRGSCLNEVVKGPLPPFEGGVVHGNLAIGSEDVPRFNFDGDDEVLEEGEGEVESAERGVSSYCAGMGSDRAYCTE